MKVGVHLLAELDVKTFGEMVRRADAYGFTRISTGDVQGNHLELVTALTYMVTLTTRAQIGPHVTQPMTRHPGVLASALASLDLLSNGRAFMVLGRGDGVVRNLGLRPATTARMRAFLLAVRELLGSGHAEYDGKPVRLTWPDRDVARRVPLMLAAEGPRTLDLAAEVADGVLVGTALTPAVVEETSNRLRAAVRANGRDPGVFSIWWKLTCAVTERGEPVHPRARESLSSGGNHAFHGDYRAKRVPPELHEKLARYHAEYDYAEKNPTGGGKNVQLMESLGLEAFFRDSFAAHGTPDEIAERLRGLRDLGIENITLVVWSARELDLIGTRVLPRLIQQGILTS